MIRGNGTGATRSMIAAALFSMAIGAATFAGCGGGDDSSGGATTTDAGSGDAAPLVDSAVHDATATDTSTTVTCGADQLTCSGECTNVKTDSANCGACGKICSAGEVCSAGSCGETCGGEEAKCTLDGGAPYCANEKTDNANCGGCGITCGAGTVCSNGSCQTTCGTGLTLCDTDGGADSGAPYCANEQTDNANCGGCGTLCTAGFTCSGGHCVSTCVPGTATLSYSGAITTFGAPCGLIHIQAFGAQGGSASTAGGLGAAMSGDFVVAPGQLFSILVGQQPPSGNGGGGGTFVVDTLTGAPLIIAGGGGGGAGECCGEQVAGSSGVIDPNGTAGTAPSCTAGNGGTGGATDNGSAGTDSSEYGSGGGGGLVDDGSNGASFATAGLGGKSFANGGAGGAGDTAGGFGGGGGSSNNGAWVNGAGGGGGGYAGGGGSCGASQWGSGGGGGSFNSGANPVNTTGAHSGNGQVIVSW